MEIWFTLPYWLRELITSCLIIVVGLFLSKVVTNLIGLISKRLAARSQTKLDDYLLKNIKKPIFWLGVVVTFSILLNRWRISGEVVPEWAFVPLDGAVYIIGVLAVLFLIMGIFGALRDWYRNYIAPKTETRFDDEFIPLVDRTFKIVLSILALIIVLDHFKVDIKGLVAVLGVSSLAVALAAQDTLANMIAGFIIMLDRPFRIGDRIKVAESELGDVYEIGLRTTKLLTFDNTLIIIPNAEIVKTEINNLSYPDPLIRVPIHVGVSYSTDVERAIEVLIETAKGHPKVIESPEPNVHFLNFGDSSLDLRLVCYVETYSDQFMTGCQLRGEIVKRFREESIEIPFPQRDLNFRNPLEFAKDRMVSD